MTLRFFMAGFLGLGTVLTVVPVVLAISRRVERLSRGPDVHHGPVIPVPRVGGLALVAAFVIVNLFAGIISPASRSNLFSQPVILLSCLAMFTLGFIDDLKPLGARKKLLGQVLIAIAVCWFGFGIQSLKIPFTGQVIPLGLWGTVLTVLWLVGTTNAALLRPNDERHSFLEAYRGLRSSLLFMDESKKVPKTVLVTSSVPHDGKSITSVNLAITLANGGSKVLLVDGDLRKGSQHIRFDFEEGPGLSEALSERRPWTDLVRDTGIPRLSLLPRGGATQFSSELFLSDCVDTLLTEAIAKYDFVIVDSAPVMAADDVTSLAPRMDGVLFVIRAEFTSARVAHAALDSLYQRQVRVLGLVFNAIRTSSLDYHHYYKYKDYYSSSLKSQNNVGKQVNREQKTQG